MIVRYQDKDLTYLMREGEKRDTFFRKVSYLVNYSLKEDQEGSPAKRQN